jgi:hypothetical protein
MYQLSDSTKTSTDFEHLHKPGSVARIASSHLDFPESHNSGDAASEYLLDSESTPSLMPSAIHSASHGDLSLSTPSNKSTSYLYNHGGTSRIIALGGLVMSLLFSIFCIAVGIIIAIFKPGGILKIIASAQHNTVGTELLSLALNLIVTACTESIGFVHAKSLQYALASESRLHFKTNMRLVTAVRRKRWTSPNGVIFNAIMAMLLIISYVSSSIVFVLDDLSWNTWVLSPAVIMLGVSLLLQAMIAYGGVRRNTQIITWSSSQFDATAALLHNDYLVPVSGRSMCNVLESRLDLGPKMPDKYQPSAWKAHPSIKPTIIFLWSIVPACAIWGGILIGIGKKFNLFQNGHLGDGHFVGSWSLLPGPHTHMVYFVFSLTSWDPFGWWVDLSIIIAIQGALTIGLHCSEIIVNVVRDETAWRRATSKEGVRLSNNPLATVLGSWENVALLIAKPVLREL